MKLSKRSRQTKVIDVKLKELKESLKAIGIVVSKSKTETINNKTAYKIKGEPGLFTKEYLTFLIAG